MQNNIKRKPLYVDLMCDKCFRMLNQDEERSAINLVDDNGKERMFSGHTYCMEYLSKELQNIYYKENE